MSNLWENPMETDGFEFVEYTAPDPALLDELFVSMGFRKVAVHRSKNVFLYRQGGVNFVVNAEEGSFGQRFAEEHGPSACAMAFRVKDAAFAYKELLKNGAKPVDNPVGPMELNIPAIEGIGGSRIYLVDRYGAQEIYDVDFVPVDGSSMEHEGSGLKTIDHVTHNVFQGNMDTWSGFYERLFNFKEVRYFDIEGKLTGLRSKAMTSPCGLIRIPVNESADDKSQIAEYLRDYKGEGIQHIALSTDDIYKSVEAIAATGIPFQDTLSSYYDGVEERVPGHGEDLERMKALKVLVDGAPTEGQGLLLQIFTQNAIGPIFFEIIQRKGNEGFGEGNFQALFDSIELDQIRRGVLSDVPQKEAS